uniref:MADS-box domain-containing protein n=1 Tax=Oryza barthii TaxID=65489 RepID=A0A0D3FU13_9ORYZ
MACKKVKLQRIVIDVKRRVTLMKRLKGLTKKVSEFATLFLMVYGEVEVQATKVWPSVWEAAKVLEHFKAMPQLDRYKKMSNLEGILNEQVDKLKEQLHKVGRDADENEAKLLLIEALNGRRPSLKGLTIEQITSLGWMANARLKIVNDRLKKLCEQGLIPASMSLSSTEVLPYTMVGYIAVDEAPIQREGWLMDVARGISSMGYNRFGGSSGSGTAGSNGDMV